MCVYEEFKKEKNALKRSDAYKMPVPLDPNEEFNCKEIQAIFQCTDEHRPLLQPVNSGLSKEKDANLWVFYIYCPGIQWQSQNDPGTICKHCPLIALATPHTVMFEVAVKLSVQHDVHLSHEAANYHKLPEHFFQNWSEYNLVWLLCDPVPVNALIPQFYGYYVPDGDAHDGNDLCVTEYLSLILLLEHCGAPLDPAMLSLDEKEECASLLLCFNHAGWLHKSITNCNVLVKEVSEPAEDDEDVTLPKCQLCFCLIDFGWSKQLEGGDRALLYCETQEAMKLSHGLLL
ncbi:hypothetical protein V8B97DRAFT_1915781 [Scleroderma yunnanense]